MDPDEAYEQFRDVSEILTNFRHNVLHGKSIFGEHGIQLPKNQQAGASSSESAELRKEEAIEEKKQL